MTLDDRTYFLRRALQEDEAARKATSAEVRERHLELAEAYRFRCRADRLPLRARQSVEEEVVARPPTMLPAA
jgi:hypothetical protein